MTQDLRFRMITPADQPLINHIMREGKGFWGYSKEELDRFMKTFGVTDRNYFDKSFGYIAESPQGTIGYYIFKIQENELMLDHFYLETQFIGQGYGRQLWNHCISIVQQKEWSEFTFWSEPHSLGFYENMGAIKIGERPMVTLPGHMAPIMRFSIPLTQHFS